jgi:hypothetical protein
MQPIPIKRDRALGVPESGTLRMLIPRRRKLQSIRALAVARNSNFGGRLMQAHKDRQQRIAREIEEKLRAFMELMANKD